ncbi:MAG: cytochrome P450 [Gammaproteobacteria bacterium]|nr:cytochrome P450 [Gammaproteobacteria bacterium]
MSTNYLQLYDQASEAEKYPLVKQWIDEEPLAFFKQLREERPILDTPEFTVLSRFDDVTEVLGMPKVFTVDLYKPKMADYLMAHDDDALHYREKSLMQSLLNRDDLPHIRQLVADIANEILDQADGKLELAYGYSRAVPAVMVQRYFGLRGSKREDLIRWSYWNQYDAFHNQPFNLNSAEKTQHITDEHDKVSAELGAYIAKLMVRRALFVNIEKVTNVILAPLLMVGRLLRHLTGRTKKGLQDDMVTRMLRMKFPKEYDFNIVRLGINAGGLLIGSIETTSQAVSQIVAYMYEHPDVLQQAQRAARAADPAAFDAIVWETLRYVPIGPFLFRKAASDYTVGRGTERETTIPKGKVVLAATLSAMFDPLIFERPDEFLPTRNWYHYFHFGFGSHECLGKYIGMVMIPEMVRQLLRREEVRPSAEIDYQDGPFPENYPFIWRK